MDIRKCRVEAAVLGNGFSRQLGPGQMVNLDERLAAGVTLRDVVDPAWFEPEVPAEPENEE